MEDKKTTRKIDFLKISKEEQNDVLIVAVTKAQEEQNELENEYKRQFSPKPALSN